MLNLNTEASSTIFFIIFLGYIGYISNTKNNEKIPQKGIMELILQEQKTCNLLTKIDATIKLDLNNQLRKNLKCQAPIPLLNIVEYYYLNIDCGLLKNKLILKYLELFKSKINSIKEIKTDMNNKEHLYNFQETMNDGSSKSKDFKNKKNVKKIKIMVV